MKFSYTALTRDNKKITGILDVENLDAARADLHKMGLAVITVSEISDEEYEKLQKEQKAVKAERGIRTFLFLAIDANGKEVEGTIDSMDKFSAYKRLRTEYKLKINNLYPAGAAEAEIKKAEAELEGLETQLQQEEELKKEEEKEAEGAEAQISKELVDEIDHVIVNAKKILEGHNELFSQELLQEIKKTLGTLELIRTSTNIKHITEVSNELYTLISNPDKIEGEVEDETYKKTIDQIEESALVRKEFELYKKAIEVTGVKKIFKNIAEKLKALTETKAEEGKPLGTVGKFKKKIHSFAEKLTKKKPSKPKLIKKEKKPKSRFGVFLEKLMDYIKAPSPVLKRTRKKELSKAIKSIFRKKPKKAAVPEPEQAREVPAEEVREKEAVPAKAAEEAVPAEKKPEEVPVKEKVKVRKKRDYTYIFAEIDSFIGWLLCFYIIYFFLVNFSLEKNIGLSRDFIFRTLKTPLILNITIFLLIIHFALRMRNLHFRQNFLATLFLLCLSLGIYALLIVNF